MTTANTMSLTLEELTAVGISAIIAKAATLARDPELNKWNLYEQAKAVIAEMSLISDEYEDAIKRLTEALNV